MRYVGLCEICIRQCQNAMQITHRYHGRNYCAIIGYTFKNKTRKFSKCSFMHFSLATIIYWGNFVCSFVHLCTCPLCRIKLNSHCKYPVFFWTKIPKSVLNATIPASLCLLKLSPFPRLPSKKLARSETSAQKNVLLVKIVSLRMFHSLSHKSSTCKSHSIKVSLLFTYCQIIEKKSYISWSVAQRLSSNDLIFHQQFPIVVPNFLLTISNLNLTNRFS